MTEKHTDRRRPHPPTRLDIIKTVNAVVLFVTLLCSIVGGTLALNAWFIKRVEALQIELEIRAAILDQAIQDNAASVRYYKSKKARGTLDDADSRRLEYLTEKLAREYKAQEDNNQRLRNLKERD